jgi:threonine/homoserine/homoserine lactone efflux protein
VAATAEARPPVVSGRRMFAHTWLVTALNPKSIVFFVAFLPQFIDPARTLLGQLVVMEATFLVLARLNATLYAMLAAAARRGIRRPAVQRAVNRIGGSLLVGAGLLTATLRRAEP